MGVLVATGDLMLTRPPAGAGVRWLGEADLSVVNLEVPLCTGGRPAEKLINLRASPALAPALRAAGVRVASVANNHALDFGPEGLAQTLQALRGAGIQPVGGGGTVQEALAPAVVRVGDTTVACLGLACTLPPGFAAGPTWAGIAPIHITYTVVFDAPTLEEQPGTSPYVRTAAVAEDVARAEDAIRSARRQADLVVLAVHWGVPSGWVAAFQGPLAEYQRPLGRRLIDAGADVIVGHHPHTLHGVERYRDGLICYSLGNFLFHSLGRGEELVIARPGTPPYDLATLTSGEALEGAVLVVEVGGGRIRSARLRPLILDEAGEPQPAGDRAVAILDRIAAQSRRLGATFAVADGELILL
ncbi:MAG: CapA family protein [Armatimonadota bacterium]|nr:CapA family protein [Armatimonadota bacterium]MDR7544880.1 CapA family protein [Armatimonadota bacterium]